MTSGVVYRDSSDQTTRPRWLARIGWLVLLALGLSAVMIGGRRLLDALDMQVWPTTTGTITSAGYSEQMGMARLGQTAQYVVSVTYQYQVDGQAYTSSQVHFWSGLDVYGSASLAEQAAAAYLPGQAVTVYYKPGSPQTAVLNCEAGSYGGSDMLAVGVALSVSATAFIYRTTYRRPRSRE
jgi:hypothetical protein